MSTAVITDSQAYLFRQGVQIAQEMQRGLVLQLRIIFKRLVEIVHVSLVMLVMMHRHGPSVNVRFQRTFFIGKIG